MVLSYCCKTTRKSPMLKLSLFVSWLVGAPPVSQKIISGLDYDKEIPFACVVERVKDVYLQFCAKHIYRAH